MRTCLLDVKNVKLATWLNITENEFNGLAETQRTELHQRVRMYDVELMKLLEKVELDVKDLGLTISQARSSKLLKDLVKSLGEIASLRTK